MSATVNQPSPCPNCGRPMPAGALAGLCPACLLAQGVEAGSNEARSPGRFQPLPVEELARLFPQLEIVCLLGAGGMGAVYQARQPALDRLVALKILPSKGVSGANFEERFNREARALARLSHPNIVAVHEFGQAGGLHFFIMEFVDGANLRQLEEAGRLSPREALQIIPQICDALQYAHDEGVVHRDIKPENVLVDRKGRVKIADFGLAKILGQEAESLRLTAEDQVMGTPHYMAPEQVERPLAVDHRADIYALGVVFYEMLTGDLPLGKFPPPSRKVQVDVRLDEVVLRALENDPERRFQHASEVKSRVETIAGSPQAGAAEASFSKPDVEFIRSAGFALLARRGSNIEVHWKGVVLAFAVIFGLLTIAFGLVSLSIGRSWMGWIGVVGLPSVMARAALSAVGVGWALRRAWLRWDRPAEAALPPKTPQGTMILSPGRTSRDSSANREWWWSRKPGVVLIGLACLAIVLGTAKRREQRGGFDFPAQQVAERDAATGALVARLPGSGKVELLAVGETNAAPSGWWAPNGTPITNITYEVRDAVQGQASGRVSKDLLIRVRDLPNDASEAGDECDPPSGGGSGGQVIRNGQLLERAVQMRRIWEPDTRRATVRLGFGLKPWRTITVQDARSMSGTQTREAGDPNWHVTFHRATQGEKGEAQISVVFGPEDRRWMFRVIAVDTNGVEHSMRSGQGTPVEKLALWTYTFHKLSLAATKEFHLQVRPVHWVEFRDVALVPRHTKTAPALRYSLVHELSVSEFIDLNTGRLTKAPEDDRDFNPFNVTPVLLSWMQENGLDAHGGVAKLETLGVTVVDLQSADWQSLQPDALKRKLDEHGRFPSELRPSSNGEAPATFGFRTREGGVGLLQLLAVDERRRELKVRYKLVEAAGE